MLNKSFKCKIELKYNQIFKINLLFKLIHQNKDYSMNEYK